MPFPSYLDLFIDEMACYGGPDSTIEGEPADEIKSLWTVHPQGTNYMQRISCGVSTVVRIL